MANPRYNTQIRTLDESTKGGKGVEPLKGEPQKSDLPLRVAPWPGLPGKAQSKDRANQIPEEKVYAQCEGLRGGKDDDPGPSPGPTGKIVRKTKGEG